MYITIIRKSNCTLYDNITRQAMLNKAQYRVPILFYEKNYDHGFQSMECMCTKNKVWAFLYYATV